MSLTPKDFLLNSTSLLYCLGNGTYSVLVPDLRGEHPALVDFLVYVIDRLKEFFLF